MLTYDVPADPEYLAEVVIGTGELAEGHVATVRVLWAVLHTSY